MPVKYICVGFIPAKKDIRPNIYLEEGQCLSKAKDVPRAKPEALPRLCEIFVGVGSTVMLSE